MGRFEHRLELPKAIDLTDDERRLAVIVFADDARYSHQQHLSQLNAQRDLALSLLKREAIPEIRVRYFADANLHTGHGTGSNLDEFRRHGLSDDEIFKHPHFQEYLAYFISGPKLPKLVMEGFIRILQDDLGGSGTVMKTLLAFVRSQVRTYEFRVEHGFNPSEEFFKLAMEVTNDVSLSHMVRRDVLSVLSQQRRAHR